MMIPIVVTLLVSMAAAEVDLNAPFHACGPSLTASISYYCNQTRRYIPKRDTMALDSDEPQLQVRRNFLNAGWARKKRGVADECCLNNCTIGALMEYCASYQ